MAAARSFPARTSLNGGWPPRLLLAADGGTVDLLGVYLWACELAATFPEATQAVRYALIPKAGMVFRPRRPIALSGELFRLWGKAMREDARR